MRPKKLRHPALRSHRPGRQADARETTGLRSQKPSTVLRVRPGSLRVQAQGRASRWSAICWWWMRPDGEMCVMASLLGRPCQPSALLLVVMWISCPRWGPPGVADLINSGALPVAGSRRCSPGASSRIITTGHAINAAPVPDLRPPPARPPSELLFPCLPTRPKSSGGPFDSYKVVASASRARFCLDQSPGAGLLPDGARLVVVPLTQHRAAAAAHPTPRAGGSASAGRFARPTGGMRCGKTDYEEEVFQRRCRAQVGKQSMPIDSELDGALSSGNPGAATAASVPMAGLVNSTTWLPASPARSNKSQGKRLPRCGHPPAHHVTTPAAAQSWCTPASRRQASLVVAGGAEKHWRLAVKNHLAAGLVTPSWRSGSVISCQGTRRSWLLLLCAVAIALMPPSLWRGGSALPVLDNQAGGSINESEQSEEHMSKT